MKEFLREIENRVLVFDGSKGYMLQRHGLKGGECPDFWNVAHPEIVRNVYESYRDAGSDVIQTNTFTGNRVCLEKHGLGERAYEINYEGARIAREVMGANGFVAASIGPTGKLFEPSGELTFESAYEVFKEQVKAVADGGVDIINFETFTDIAEMRAAYLAAKETANLPVICSMAFEAIGRTIMGTDPSVAAAVLKSLGSDIVGANCSLGPEHLLGIIRNMSGNGVYLAAKPNAGLPEVIDGKTVYRETPERFASFAGNFVRCGVRLLGGCCGTTPEFIRAIRASIEGISAPEAYNGRRRRLITSSVRMLELREGKIDINIRMLSSDLDERLACELSKGNLNYIEDISMDISAEDPDAVYINIDGVERAGADERLLADVVNIAQGYIKAPFIIETRNPEALEHALRLYRGIAGVAAGCYGCKELEALKKVADKYGGLIIDKKTILR